MKTETKTSVLRLAGPYVLITLLSALMAANYVLFIVPNDFAPAGIGGIATMVQYKAGFSLGYFSLLINIPLCFFAFFFLRRRFALRTLWYCLCNSGLYLLFQQTGMLDALRYDAGGTDTIFPCILAGAVSGFSYALCLKFGGSTGGTDVVSSFVSARRPHLSFFWVQFALNTVVAGISLFVYTDPDGGFYWKPVCLCMVYCFLSSLVGSLMQRGAKKAYQFQIITAHAREIENDILTRLHHGATHVMGRGVYSGDDRDIIICVVNPNQVVEFEALLRRYDHTFAFVETVYETIGNFKKIKSVPLPPDLSEGQDENAPQ